MTEYVEIAKVPLIGDALPESFRAAAFTTGYETDPEVMVEDIRDRKNDNESLYVVNDAHTISRKPNNVVGSREVTCLGLVGGRWHSHTITAYFTADGRVWANYVDATSF